MCALIQGVDDQQSTEGEVEEDCRPAIHTGNSTPVEGEIDEEEKGEAMAEAATAQIVEVIPTHYCWHSTLRPSPDAPPRDTFFLGDIFQSASLPPIQSGAAPDFYAHGDIKTKTTKHQKQEQ